MRPIPEAKGHPVFGLMRELASAPHRLPAELALKHGGVVSFRALHRRLVAVTDPDLAQEVLVTRWQRYVRTRQSRNLGIISRGLLALSGEEWLERRRLAQPAFNRNMLTALVATTRDCVSDLMPAWAAEQRQDGTVALQTAMLRLSMATIARMLLSATVPIQVADRVGELLRRGLALILQRNFAIFAPPLWLPTHANRDLRAVSRELNDFVAGHLVARTDDATLHSDLYAALRAARDPRSGKVFTPEELLEETKTLFFAGYETTATALTWTLYSLARHPAIAEKAAEEIDRVLGGRDPNVEDLSALPYTQAVLRESMRLYPPVYGLVRQATVDDEIAGYRIARDTTVLISIFGLHRAPVWGAEPEAFQPERFLRPDWPRRAFMPFGAGRHLCIGVDFAEVEMLVALAMILRRYRLSVTAAVGIRPRITLAPDQEIRVHLSPR